MDLIAIAVLILASWRIAFLLAHESGPFGLCEKLRHKLGVKYNEQSEMIGTNRVSRAIICVWCTSVYIGVALTIFYALIPQVALYVMLPFAVSSGAIMIQMSRPIQRYFG